MLITALRRRLCRDDGVSLVETLAALLIVGVVLMALAATTMSSIAAASGNERQSRASQVGNELLETLQGLPFDDVAFYSGDFAGTPPPGTVIRAGTRPAGARVPLPQGSEVVDGLTYQYVAGIVWTDDSSDGISCAVSAVSGCDADPTDYKQLSVRLSWSAGGRTRTLRFDGRRSHLLAAGGVTPFKFTSFVVRPADEATNPLAINQLLQQSTTGCGTSTPQRYRLRVPLTVTVTVNRPAATASFNATGLPGALTLTSSDGGLTWTTTIPDTTCFSEGTKTLTYQAQTSSGEAAQQTEALWFGRQEEQFISIANVVLEQAAVVTRSPSRSVCETVMRFDVMGIGGTTTPTVRFSYLSGSWDDTVVATQSTSTGSATSGFRVSYSYTTTAPGVRSYRAVVAAGANMSPPQATFTARADVPSGDFDEESRSLPVASGSSC